MKKIFLIMPNLKGGGAERVASILVNQFVKHGYDTTLVFVKSDEIQYNLDSRVKIDKSIMYKKRNPLKQILDIRKYMQANKDNIFISFLTYQNIYASIARLGIKQKLILSLRNAPQNIQGGGIIARVSAWLSFALADNIVFQTEDARQYYPKFIQRKGTVILNPLQDSIPEYNVENTKNALISFCRLEPQKNLPLAINAFSRFHKKNDSFTYTIFGNGELKEDLLALINSLGLNGVITIRDFEKNILEEATKYRMFVLSSHFEGLSNSMIEAVAMGMPCVCTDCPIGGARMVIENEKNGFLVPVGDVEAMATAMENATDINKCLQISKFAKDSANVFSSELIANQWISLIEN